MIGICGGGMSPPDPSPRPSPLPKGRGRSEGRSFEHSIAASFAERLAPILPLPFGRGEGRGEGSGGDLRSRRGRRPRHNFPPPHVGGYVARRKSLIVSWFRLEIGTETDCLSRLRVKRNALVAIMQNAGISEQRINRGFGQLSIFPAQADFEATPRAKSVHLAIRPGLRQG